jgi:hypothetical protein
MHDNQKQSRDIRRFTGVLPWFEKANRVACKTDKFFLVCCERAGCAPTARQYSKFKNRRGLAHQHRKVKVA